MLSDGQSKARACIAFGRGGNNKSFMVIRVMKQLPKNYIVKALYFHERNLTSVIVGNNTKLKEIEVKDITH